MIEAVTAKYYPSTFPTYRGNRLIEALPDYTSWTNKHIEQTLSEECNQDLYPQASRRQKDLWLDGLLQNLFIPLVRHLRLQELIDTVIRQGYAATSPSSPEDVKRICEAYERQQQGEKEAIKYAKPTPMLSISVTGCSGMGKTSSIKRILGMYPQLIKHDYWPNAQNFMQIVYLAVECPHNGSVKSLCAAIIKAIDDITGENFYEVYVLKSRSNAETLRQGVSHLLALYHVGILFIDEFQNIMQSSKEREQLFNFIVSLSNSLGVPLLFAGTPKVKAFLQHDLRISRRFGTVGALSWHPLSHDSNEWKIFINQLWKCCILKDRPPTIPQNIDNALFDCSQGIIDILTRLFILSQKAVLIRSKRNKELEMLTVDDIYLAYEDGFSSVDPMIKALKSGNAKLIEQFADLDFTHESWEKTVEDYTKQLYDLTQGEEITSDEDLIFNKVIRILIINECKISNEIKNWLHSYIKDHPGASLMELVSNALEFYKDFKAQPVTSKVKRHKQDPLEAPQEVTMEALK